MAVCLSNILSQNIEAYKTAMVTVLVNVNVLTNQMKERKMCVLFTKAELEFQLIKLQKAGLLTVNSTVG